MIHHVKEAGKEQELEKHEGTGVAMQGSKSSNALIHTESKRKQKQMKQQCTDRSRAGKEQRENTRNTNRENGWEGTVGCVLGRGLGGFKVSE